MNAAIEALWRAETPTIAPDPQQTEIEVHVAPAGMLAEPNPLSRHFPGAYQGINRSLHPQRVWATWVHHRPGNPRGTRYDGLVWVDDHWAWFPKPWRLLDAAGGREEE